MVSDQSSINQLSRKRRRWLWFLPIILFALFLYGVITLWPLVKYYFPTTFHKSVDSTLGRNIDPEKEIIRVDLKGYIANIPENYFWRKYQFSGRWWKASQEREKIDALTIVVLLPELLPWHKDLAGEFEKPDADTLSVSMSVEKTPDWPFIYFRNVRKRLELVPGSDAAPGLLHFRDTITDDDVFLEFDEPRQKMIKVICARRDKGFNSCWNMASNYQDHYNLSYRYPRRFIKEWRAIDSNIKQLFDTFPITNK